MVIKFWEPPLHLKYYKHPLIYSDDFPSINMVEEGIMDHFIKSAQRID